MEYPPVFERRSRLLFGTVQSGTVNHVMNRMVKYAIFEGRSSYYSALFSLEPASYDEQNERCNTLK